MPKPEFWQIPAATAAATERADKLEAALAERLQHIAERFPRAVLASSLAVEDMIITDQICRHALPIRIAPPPAASRHSPCCRWWSRPRAR